MNTTPPPGAPATPGPAPLDAGALSRLRELDPDGRHGVLQRVLAAFETSLARMLVQLAAELEDGDAGVVSAVAHTLKSSSAQRTHSWVSLFIENFAVRQDLPGKEVGPLGAFRRPNQ